MDYKALFIIGILTVSVLVGAVIFFFAFLKKMDIPISFEGLYPRKTFNKVHEDSKLAGKINSPKIEQDIMKTAIEGADICNGIGCMFAEGIDYGK